MFAQMVVEVKRASVALGDDIEAPHLLRLRLRDSASLKLIVKSIMDRDYLPRIAHPIATWVFVADAPFAVLSQSNSEPRWLASSDWIFSDWSPSCSVYIHYLAQIPVDEVVRALDESA